MRLSVVSLFAGVVKRAWTLNLRGFFPSPAAMMKRAMSLDDPYAHTRSLLNKQCDSFLASEMYTDYCRYDLSVYFHEDDVGDQHYTLLVSKAPHDFNARDLEVSLEAGWPDGYTPVTQGSSAIDLIHVRYRRI